MSIERLREIWPEWKHEEKPLGEGSFGKVYKAVREEHGLQTYCAIKVLKIPQSESELNSLRSEGWSTEATRSYFEGIVDDFIKEIKLMEAMKGNTNIVSVEDYRVLEKADGMGWDIFIRMELLTSFNAHADGKQFTEGEVIKLGEDILTALELCASRNIIHRDIKPENIFVSNFGHYKLGDFGIAREMEKTAGSMSQKGTYNYMAPEVEKGAEYDASVDIYSLGLVLYRLLNNNKLPFINPQAEEVQYREREQAVKRRMSGESLPPPINASEAMSRAVLKACAFEPGDRYSSVKEFKDELNAVKTSAAAAPDKPKSEINGTVIIKRGLDDTNIETETETNGNKSSNNDNGNNSNNSNNGIKKKKKKSAAKAFGIIGIIVLLICILGGGVYFAVNYFFGANDITGEIIDALRNREFKEAQRLYDNVIYSDDLSKLENRLNDRLDDLKSEFETGETNYETAVSEISTIRGFRIRPLNGKIDSIEEEIENLNAEQIELKSAEEAESSDENNEEEIEFEAENKTAEDLSETVNINMPDSPQEKYDEDEEEEYHTETEPELPEVETAREELPVFRAVTSITGVPASTAAGSVLTLTGTVNPSDAVNKRITWSVANAGTTGAVINGNNLNTSSTGTATIRAIIDNGEAEGRHYIQDFNITVTAPVTYRVSADTNDPTLGRGAVWTGTGGDKESDWVSSRNFTQGSNVHLRAFPKQGYAFYRWEVAAGSAVITDASSVSASFRMPSGDVTVRAVFKPHDFYVVNAGRSVLNVRAAPDVDSEVIDRLNSGDIVQVTQIVPATDNVNGDWAWIGYGWSNMDYLLPWP